MRRLVNDADSALLYAGINIHGLVARNNWCLKFKKVITTLWKEHLHLAIFTMGSQPILIPMGKGLRSERI